MSLPSDDVSCYLPPLQVLTSPTFLDRFIAAARQAVVAHLSAYPESHEDTYHASHCPYVDVQAFITNADDWLLVLVGVIEHKPGRPQAKLCVIGTYSGLIGNAFPVAVGQGLYLWVASDTGYSADTVIQALENIAFLVQRR